MPLTRLTYFSQNQINAEHASVLHSLKIILKSSERNNKIKGVTGALVFDDLWFIQVLEGERAQVWETFERIREDDRHSDLVIAELVDADARVFANWWMGLATRNAKTEAVFARFSHNGRLDPRRMSASEMLSMSTALAKLGLSRELAGNQNADVPAFHPMG